MLCGDVPWEGSSRRPVSLEAPCHVEFYVRSTGTRRSRAVGERQESLSLRVSPPARPVIVSFLPTHCLVFGLSLLWGWVRSPEVLTRPRSSAQGSQTFGSPPYAIVGRDDHFDWLSYKFAKASTHSAAGVAATWQ